MFLHTYGKQILILGRLNIEDASNAAYKYHVHFYNRENTVRKEEKQVPMQLMVNEGLCGILTNHTAFYFILFYFLAFNL